MHLTVFEGLRGSPTEIREEFGSNPLSNHIKSTKSIETGDFNGNHQERFFTHRPILVAHPICTTDQGPNVLVSKNLS